MSLNAMGTVGDLLVDTIERFSDRIAVEDDGREISYRQFGRDVTGTIDFFQQHGVEPGDRIAQITANCYEQLVVITAAYIGGYGSLALQYNADFDDHQYALEDIRPSIVFVDDERRDRLSALKENCNYHFSGFDYKTLKGFLRSNEPRAIGSFRGATQADQLARLNQTGGTSGRPKVVTISSGALTYTILAHATANAFDADTKILICSPISHGGGSFIHPVLLKGGRAIIEKKFDPQHVVAGGISGRINTLFMVPTMMYTLLDHPDATAIQPGMLKRIIYGAAPSSPQRLRQAIDTFGPVLLQSYGQSEAPGTILYLSPEDHMHPEDKRLTSAGKPYPGVSVKLILHGEEIPFGSDEVGEICVRGPHVMMGYWNAPELSAEAFDGGWLHTGDMARMDADGFYYIVSRMKDMIISGGFNVYASEVENTLEQHPAVNTSAVIGVPDEKWGEAVTAFVVLEEGAAVSEEALSQFVRNKKGPIKTPKTITFLDELPLTKVGKVDKKVLRSAYWDGGDREVN